ncbi:MAG: hypothetical protein OEZ20_01280 [candidate division WOR-3 bacterium]|nr:hypothetical protein [candidate division WOR-3 bacterium]MDH5683089.1 hypothetical protein [candidate division WOR-3 bacterium]
MGVREAKYRLEKWRIKKYESKGKKLSPETEAKMSKVFTQQVALETTIKMILDKIGVSTTMYVPYLSVGMEINGLTRRYSGDELNKRIESVMAKWLGRKLDKTILEKIKKCVLDRKF